MKRVSRKLKNSLILGALSLFTVLSFQNCGNAFKAAIEPIDGVAIESSKSEETVPQGNASQDASALKKCLNPDTNVQVSAGAIFNQSYYLKAAGINQQDCATAKTQIVSSCDGATGTFIPKIPAAKDRNAVCKYPPSILTFTSDKAQVDAGQSVLLKWTFEGFEIPTITLDVYENGIKIKTISSFMNNQYSESLSVSRQYTLIASNSLGFISKSVSISVNGQPQPPVIMAPMISNLAVPTPIARGQNAQISWLASGSGPLAYQLEILDGSNQVVQTISNLSGTSYTDIKPSSNRSYRLKVTNSVGSDTKSVSVVVNQPEFVVPDLTFVIGVVPSIDLNTFLPTEVNRGGTFSYEVCLDGSCQSLSSTQFNLGGTDGRTIPNGILSLATGAVAGTTAGVILTYTEP